MSLTMLYSFDHVATANMSQLPSVISVGPGCAIGPSSGRGGTGGLLVTDLLTGGQTGFNFAVPVAQDYTIGAWVVIEGTPLVDATLLVFGNPIISVLGSQDKLITLSPQPDGSVKVWSGAAGAGNGGGLLALSATGLLTYGPDEAHYIEMRVFTPGGPGGSLFVNIDGVPVISFPLINTTLVGATFTTHIMLGNPAGSPRTRYDDLYLTNPDVAGTPWINLMGVIQVEGKLVNAAGEVTQWTPSTPTGVNFTNVNETVANLNTFNSANAIGLVDLYNIEDVTYNPLGVQVDFLLRKTGLGACTVSHVKRPTPGGSNEVAPEQALLTTPKYYRGIYPVSSGGVPWTSALFNQAQFGVSKIT